MNSNLSLGGYVSTFFLRSFFSLLVAGVSCVGLAIVVNNYTGNDFKMEPKNKELMQFYFAGTLILEAAQVCWNVFLWNSQRKLQDLSQTL